MKPPVEQGGVGEQQYILWRNRPMRELIKIRNLKERDCATVA
jgi:hypothetical protein